MRYRSLDLKKTLTLECCETKSNPVGGLTKRFADILCSLIFFPIFLPFLIIIATLLLLTGNSRVFYGHRRIGFGGRSFICWKFQTMVGNSDEILQKYLDENVKERDVWLRERKLRIDPRVTTLGNFLRKTSLDEIPQILNVLIGDMSFVGPRPIAYDELSNYGSSARYYLRNRPGITGLWQVSGRSDTTYNVRVAKDRYYTQHYSLVGDLCLIGATIPVVLFRKGAR